MTYNRVPGIRVEYEQRWMCKPSPDASQIEMVTFSDNPKTEDMFHGEHGFIYIDSTSVELRLRRHTFLDSQDRAFSWRRKEQTWPRTEIQSASIALTNAASCTKELSKE
jgi:hypothetical protein